MDITSNAVNMFLFSERDKLIQINECKKSIKVLTTRMAAMHLILKDLNEVDDYVEFLQGEYDRSIDYIQFMHDSYDKMQLELIRLERRLDRHRRTISADTIHQIASFM